MPIIKWSDDYALGIEIIDNQHKKIFDTLNKLYDSFVNGDGEKKYSRSIERLLSISAHHFSTEETLMRDTGYGDYFDHLQEHKLFTWQVSQLQDIVGTAQKEHTKELMEYLSNWIINHEIVRDSKIVLKPEQISPAADLPSILQ
jgi:hemerythrin